MVQMSKPSWSKQNFHFKGSVNSQMWVTKQPPKVWGLQAWVRTAGNSKGTDSETQCLKLPPLSELSWQIWKKGEGCSTWGNSNQQCTCYKNLSKGGEWGCCQLMQRASPGDNSWAPSAPGLRWESQTSLGTGSVGICWGTGVFCWSERGGTFQGQKKE